MEWAASAVIYCYCYCYARRAVGAASGAWRDARARSWGHPLAGAFGCGGRLRHFSIAVADRYVVYARRAGGAEGGACVAKAILRTLHTPLREATTLRNALQRSGAPQSCDQARNIVKDHNIVKTHNVYIPESCERITKLWNPERMWLFLQNCGVRKALMTTFFFFLGGFTALHYYGFTTTDLQ